MEDIKSIKKNYIDKIKRLIKHNELYYSKNKPLITDSEYDELKKNIINLEIKYDFLKHKDSPSKNVGFKPLKTFKKEKHKIPMLSLVNGRTPPRISSRIGPTRDFSKSVTFASSWAGAAAASSAAQIAAHSASPHSFGAELHPTSPKEAINIITLKRIVSPVFINWNKHFISYFIPSAYPS